MKAEIKSLTGIRGVAAVSVMIYHLTTHPAFAPYRLPLFGRGYLCVDLFFVLSGFIIAFIYSDLFLGGRGDARSYGRFLLNRAARVWPLAAIVTLVYGARLMLNVSGDGGYKLTLTDFFANLFMVQGWGFGTEALTGSSWSVSTEVLAYILFPLLLWLAFSRFYWVLAVLALAALGVVAASGTGISGELDVFGGRTVMPDLRCLAGFSLGLLAFRAAGLAPVRRWLSSDIALGVIMAVLAGLFLVPRTDIAIVLVCPLLIISLFYEGRVGNWLFGNPAVYYLGVVSYSIYLWHPILRDISARAAMIAQGKGIHGLDLVFIAVALIAPIVVSHFSYHWIEVKGRDFVRHLTDRRSAKVAQKA